MPRTKESIKWASKEELFWMGSLLLEKPMTKVQLIVECQKHYKNKKISESSVINQLSRLKNLTFLESSVDEKGTLRYSYPREFDKESLKDYFESFTDADIIGSSSSKKKEKEKESRWLTSNTLKKVLDIYLILKSHSWTMNFFELNRLLKATRNYDITREKIESISEKLYPRLGVLPFSFTKHGSIRFETMDNMIVDFPKVIGEILDQRGEETDIYGKVIYDEGKLAQDEINLGMMIRDTKGLGLPFDDVIRRWTQCYCSTIDKDYLSHMSKDLIEKCNGIYFVRDRKLFITNFEQFVKMVDPNQVYVDVVLICKDSYQVPSKLKTEIKKTIHLEREYQKIITLRAKNNDELRSFLRKLYAYGEGTIIHPTNLSESIENEWKKIRESFAGKP